MFKDNTAAHQCYQSHGFIEIEYPEQSLPGNMQNCVYMVLSATNQKWMLFTLKNKIYWFCFYIICIVDIQLLVAVSMIDEKVFGQVWAICFVIHS